MGKVKVTVKWGKETLKDVEVDTGAPGRSLKETLRGLTQVPLDRQKVMGKKWSGLLKDDDSLGALKDGDRLALQGTAEVLVGPSEPITFLEDLPEEERMFAGTTNTPGLVNLGNTCYMAATVQSLYSIPELRAGLEGLNEGKVAAISANVTGSMRPGDAKLTMAQKALFAQLGSSKAPVEPLAFLSVLREVAPQFAQQDARGNYSQQDAEECWGSVMACLANGTPLQALEAGSEAMEVGDPGATPRPLGLRSGAVGGNVVDALFGLEMRHTLRCSEAAEEEPTSETTLERLFKCHFNDPPKPPTSNLFTGLENGMKDTVEKVSPTLGRDAVYEKESVITRLPKFLAVQMVRFRYRRDTQQKAKILKECTFPTVLDVYPMCAQELKDSTLDKWRAVEREIRLGEAGTQSAEWNSRWEGRTEGGTDASAAPAKPDEAKKGADEGGASSSMEVDASEAQDKEGSGEKEGAQKRRREGVLRDAVETLGEQPDVPTARYELQAVLTHKGRTADSGHYVSWVRKEGSENFLCYDDEKVSEVPEGDVLKLSGGGDWHTAYILVYKALAITADR